MFSYILTYALAVASVSLWTVRVAVTARGLRMAGSAVATVEAVVFAIAFSHVLGSLETPFHLLAYAAGVGIGTFTGLSLDQFLGRQSGPGQEMKTIGPSENGVWK